MEIACKILGFKVLYAKYVQRKHVLFTLVCTANNWVITDSCPQTVSRYTVYNHTSFSRYIAVIQ
jgi:hypothetical protein